ncbi:MAG: type II secretion system protein [Caulobacteraceae bacterium]
MTLMEVLVALAIFGLILSVALSSIGPWIAHGRRIEREAGYWRDAQTAEMTVAEIAAGAVEPDTAFRRMRTRTSCRPSCHGSLHPAGQAVPVLEGLAGGVRSLILETRARSRLSAELLPAFAPLRFAAGEEPTG